MTSLIQIVEEPRLDIEYAGITCKEICDASSEKLQVFLLCLTKSEVLVDKLRKKFSLPADIISFKIDTKTSLTEFEKKIEEIVKEITVRSTGKVFVSIEGNRDPLTTLILLKLIEGLPGKIQCLSESCSVQSNCSCAFDNGSNLTATERLFLNYLQNFNYMPIMALIKQNKIPRSLTGPVNNLIKFKNMYFDNETKTEITKCVSRIRLFPELRIYRRALKEMMGLTELRQVPFIKALFFNCQIEYEQSDFVDFLVRYLRLLEELTIYALGWDEDKSGMLVYRHGHKKGKPAPVKNKDLSWLRNVLNSSNALVRKYPEFHKYLNSEKVKAVVDKRHLSIAGHGYQGVSSDVLSGAYKGDILLDLRKAIESLGIILGHNYYEVLNAFLVAEYYRLKSLNNN